MNRQAEQAATLADELHKKYYPQNTDDDDVGNENTPVAPVSLKDDDLTVPPIETPPEPKSAEHWESKFKVLQGKYNAEVPRLSKEIREANSTIQSVQTQLEVLKQTPPANVVKDLEETDLNIESYAEYGEEFEQLAKMVKQLTSQVKTLESENTSLKGSIATVESTQSNVTEDKFWMSLEQAVPEWDAINKNPDFVQWLQEVEPISGDTRQIHLDDAAGTLNATKAISIFKEFSDSATPVQQSNQLQNIARQAQPDSVVSPAPISEQKQYYSRKDIRQFYKETAQAASGRGIWVGKEAEVKAIEQDIFAAAGEGRITD